MICSTIPGLASLAPWQSAPSEHPVPSHVLIDVLPKTEIWRKQTFFPRCESGPPNRTFDSVMAILKNQCLTSLERNDQRVELLCMRKADCLLPSPPLSLNPFVQLLSVIDPFCVIYPLDMLRSPNILKRLRLWSHRWSEEYPTMVSMSICCAVKAAVVRLQKRSIVLHLQVVKRSSVYR